MMKVHFGLPDPPLGSSAPATGMCALAIGGFDGIHLGHHKVVERLVEAASAAHGLAVLATFEPHPRCVLDPAECPPSITTLDEKLHVLEPLGVDHVVVIPFTLALSHMVPEEFMNWIESAIPLGVLIAGPDFAVGHQRQGDLEWLRRRAGQRGFRVEIVPPVLIDGEELHSTEIRRLVRVGDVEAANRLLGRPFLITGRVEPGDRIGRELGFPTVNLAPEPNKLIPGQGIYAGWATTPLGTYQAALSIGHRPTFAGTQLRVEGYLLDFDGDLYDARLEVRFVARLRDELKFPSPGALAEQIARDVEETRRRLAAAEAISPLEPG